MIYPLLKVGHGRKSPLSCAAVSLSFQSCQCWLHTLRCSEAGCASAVTVNFMCHKLHSSLSPEGESAGLYLPVSLVQGPPEQLHNAQLFPVFRGPQASRALGVLSEVQDR